MRGSKIHALALAEQGAGVRCIPGGLLLEGRQSSRTPVWGAGGEKRRGEIPLCRRGRALRATLKPVQNPSAYTRSDAKGEGVGVPPPPWVSLEPLDSSPGTACVVNLLFFGPLGRCWQARRGSGTRRRAPRREGVVSCPYRAIAGVFSLQPHRRLALEVGHRGCLCVRLDTLGACRV